MDSPGTARKSSRIPTDIQNNTLRDIFQTNLDLRQSLEKLANAVNPPAVRTNGESSPARETPKPVREPAASNRDLVAQPAA